MNTDKIEIANPNLRAAAPYVGDLPVEDRMRVLKALANEAGLRLPDTILAEGTALLPVGEEARRALKGEIDALPSFIDASRALRAVVRAEDPRDKPTPVQRVRMHSSSGRLYGNGYDAAKALGYTDAGFRHVIGFVKPTSVRAGAADVLLSLPNGVRADAFNHWASVARSAEDEIVLRTIKNPASGARLIRAVTSERHSLATGDDTAVLGVLEAMPDVLRHAKMRVTRSWDRTDMEILWPALDRELRVGDIAKVAVRIVNSETKAGSLRVDAAVLRVLCYNFTTAWSADEDAEDIALRHVGDLQGKLPQAIKRALARVEPFVRAFGDAYRTALPQFAPSRGEVLERVGKRFPELAESTLTAASELWDADGERSAGDTLAGLVNALTRASQRLSMAGAASVERAAGRLVARRWDALA